MTQPPDITALLASLQITVTELRSTVTELRRTVEGDPGMGAPSIRQALKEHKEGQEKIIAELRAENTALCKRFDAFEEERCVRDARLEGQNNVIKWLGGSSLVTAVGLIVALLRLFGGGGT